MVKKEVTRFTVRIHPEISKKLVYIAEYYGRSQKGQYVWLAKQCVAAFEKEHGKIVLDEAEGK